MIAKPIFYEAYRLARIGVLEKTAATIHPNTLVIKSAYACFRTRRQPVRVTRSFQYVIHLGAYYAIVTPPVRRLTKLRSPKQREDYYGMCLVSARELAAYNQIPSLLGEPVNDPRPN